MFSFHWPEIFILLIIGALIFGPKRLPDLGSSLGRGIRDFKKTVDEFEEETGIKDVRQIGKSEIKSIRELGSDVISEVQPGAARRSPGGPNPSS
jgi:sec-independent protein translocase protein TatA